MSRVFLSHSSLDNAEAVAIRDWLAGEGLLEPEPLLSSHPLLLLDVEHNNQMLP
jgi:hypothetical protein